MCDYLVKCRGKSFKLLGVCADGTYFLGYARENICEKVGVLREAFDKPHKLGYKSVCTYSEQEREGEEYKCDEKS